MDWSRHEDIASRWRTRGRDHVRLLRRYIQRGESLGWDQVGDEPEDRRTDIADAIVAIVREANEAGEIARLRELVPPAHAPLIPLLEAKGQTVGPVVLLDDERILVVVGSAWETRSAYLVHGPAAAPVAGVICAGRSPDRRVLALGREPGIELRAGWDGALLRSIPWPREHGIAGIEIEPLRGRPTVEALVPFPDGERVLVTASEGVFIAGPDGARLIHPHRELLEKWAGDAKVHDARPLAIELPMVNAALSTAGDRILVGHQDGDHRVLTGQGQDLATVGPQSSYPHHCTFSGDGTQAIFNSCHFYNGVTVGVASTDLERGVAIAAYGDDPRLTRIDDGCRVYASAARGDEYILGDAPGYIRARSTAGEKRWEHFLGSTITGMDISADGRFLAVGSCSGMLHLIDLDVGADRDHTIGTSNHRERCRHIFWRGEPRPLVW